MDKNSLERAQSLHQQGRLKEALEAYQALLETHPDNVDLLHVVAILQAQTGDADSALLKLNRALKLSPDDPKLHNSLGNIYYRLGRFQKALEALQQAIALEPNYAVAYNNLGNAHFQLGQLSKAENAYQKAHELKKNYVDAFFNHGLVAAKLEQWPEALKYLEKTLSLMPSHQRALQQLTQVHLAMDAYDLAIKRGLQVVEFNPDEADNYYYLGQAYLQNKQYHEASVAFEQALTLNIEQEDCNHLLATAYLQLEDYAKALNYYFRQLEIAPQLETVYNIAVLLMYQERHREAIRYFNESVTMDPDNLPAHINLGGLYLKLNNLDKAILHYKKALSLKPDDQEITHILAAISQQETPDAAPAEYLQHLFDQYAQYYDKHLTDYLHYETPEKMVKAIEEELNPTPNSLTILDLGCGTGLLGPLLKPYAKHLIGIDLSENMLDIAKTKEAYDELKVGDVQQVIAQYDQLDLILAADVFTYIGNLESIFKDAHNALTPEGAFIFSVEKTHNEPYLLQRTIRYAHSKIYLESLIEQFHFKTLRFDNLVLRHQQKKPLEGYLVMLQK